jgi:putative redox protein
LSITTVYANWTGEGLNYVGVDTKGRQLDMGGHGNITPGQLLLLGFAGCMGMDVAHVLRKKRQDITNIEVKVTGHQPDGYPKPYEVVEIMFKIKGNNISPKAVERALELSKETYCVVGQTLKRPVDIKASFVIDE